MATDMQLNFRGIFECQTRIIQLFFHDPVNPIRHCSCEMILPVTNLTFPEKGILSITLTAHIHFSLLVCLQISQIPKTTELYDFMSQTLPFFFGREGKTYELCQPFYMGRRIPLHIFIFQKTIVSEVKLSLSSNTPTYDPRMVRTH